MFRFILVLLIHLAYWIYFAFWFRHYALGMYIIVYSIMPVFITIVALLPAYMKWILIGKEQKFPFQVAFKWNIIFSLLWLISSTIRISINEYEYYHPVVNECEKRNAELCEERGYGAALRLLKSKIESHAVKSTDAFFCVNYLEGTEVDTTMSGVTLTNMINLGYSMHNQQGTYFFTCFCNDTICVEGSRRVPNWQELTPAIIYDSVLKQSLRNQ